MSEGSPDDFDSAIDGLFESARQVRELVGAKADINADKRLGTKILGLSPAAFLAYCALMRALKNYSGLLRAPSMLLLIVVPPAWDIELMKSLAELTLVGSGMTKSRSPGLEIVCYPVQRSMRFEELDANEYLKFKQLMVFTHDVAGLPSEFEIAADEIVTLEIALPEHLDALSHMIDGGPLSGQTKQFICGQNPVSINAVFRRGRSVEAAVQKLQRRQKSKIVDDSRNLENMPGFGEAKNWGLQLKKDLAEWRTGALAWSEVDRGILLAGPTGTGKTLFAKALAHSCDMHLIATSVGRWQSKGHLGDLLKAMYADFAQAKAKAPALLFIDEIDAIGDRETFVDHIHYSTEVVNSLLENMDGCESREGVILLAACNYPEKIDRALLRSGRLEKRVMFNLPDETARLEILHHYLPDLQDKNALGAVAARLIGWSGADLERLARQARRSARQQLRQVEVDDVDQSLPAGQQLSPESLFRIAVHEAGHAFIAVKLGFGKLIEVRISDVVDPISTTEQGSTRVETPKRPYSTRSFLLDDIAVRLAGTVAEEIIFADRSTAAGGSAESDLSAATTIASSMIYHYGLENSLCCIPTSQSQNLFGNSELKLEVDRILQREFDRVKSILTDNKALLIRIADQLVIRKSMDEEAILKIVAPTHWDADAAPNDVVQSLDHISMEGLQG